MSAASSFWTGFAFGAIAMAVLVLILVAPFLQERIFRKGAAK